MDYENIRISLQQNFEPQVTPTQIAKSLHELATEHGEWRGGKAYADWTTRASDARAFEDLGFDARMVLRKRSGPDRSDIVMSLDMIEALDRSDDVTSYLLTSGDSDFQDVVRRLRDAGKFVIVAGCAPTTASGLISAADQFVALESRLDLKPKGLEVAERRLPGRDWASLIELIARLEKQNRYIGINRLIKQWMAEVPEIFGNSLIGRRAYIDDAKHEGIVIAYQAPLGTTQGGTKRLVWCVRLDREHPVVTSTLTLISEGDDDATTQG